MKNIIHIILSLICLWPYAVNANSLDKGKHEKSKTINKEYTVNANALVDIDNKYGNVDVATWSENRVVIEVKITVSGDSESRVQERLNQISVDFEGSRSRVYAKTKIGNNSGWSGSKNKRVHFQIDYKVKMPVTNSVKLDNDYGSISLNELKGKAEINCDYGKIIIGSLYHSSNSIHIDYTNNSVIEMMNGGEINADYSKITIEKAKKVELNADYTTTKFEHIEDLDFSCDYGKLEIDNANNINGNGDYLTMNFGKVFKSLDINADYGGLRINKLMAGFERISMDTGYTAVKIGVDREAAFNFEINTGYGGVSIDAENTTFLKKNVKSSSKYYQGFVNKENTSSIIKLSASYGAIKIYNN